MHKQKSVSEGLSLLTKMASSKLHSAPLISQFKNVASPPAAFANNLLTKSCKWLLINSESGFWVMKLISFCGHAEDKLPSTLPRNHSETAPPPAAVACDTYLFVVCLFVALCLRSRLFCNPNRYVGWGFPCQHQLFLVAAFLQPNQTEGHAL